MEFEQPKMRIAILGGGPSGLFMFKHLLESGQENIEIAIFERKMQLGAGMPYSADGANLEHVTNVSDNEVPEIVNSIKDWIQTVPNSTLEKYHIKRDKFNEYKVVPRLLFGEYLSAQFSLLQKKAQEQNIKTDFHLGQHVIDIIDHPKQQETWIQTATEEIFKFDRVIICTGHNWPKKLEGKIPGYFDSPYPPVKLNLQLNHPVAIKGSSLTAIDAIRTLARNNGKFEETKDGMLNYKLNDDSPDFKIVLHSRSGFLPAVRFHLEESLLSNDAILSHDEIEKNRTENEGFLELDYLFEKNFKQSFTSKDPIFYEKIKDMNVEEFVHSMMELREKLDAFTLFKAEYAEAAKSIKRHESIYWKEMLAILSFALNYPAKYLSAEDMIRLQKELMPLISIVIAFVPQSSCKELLALHDAGVLDLIAVGNDSEIIPNENGGVIYKYKNENLEFESHHFPTYIDCVGQPHLSYDDFPFKSLLENKIVSPARIKFKSNAAAISEIAKGNKNVELDPNGSYYLKVSGIKINDNFQILDNYGAYDKRIFILAVPYIGGYNPDYSGLDFSEAASSRVVEAIFND